MGLNRDERRNKVQELREWLRSTADEYRDEPLPLDLKQTFENYESELREHEQVIAELEERDLKLRKIAEEEENRESGVSYGAQRRSVQVVSKMSEREVFDLSNVRSNPFNPGASAMEIRDRALRANELSTYAHPDVDQTRAKTHVDKLIRRHSTGEDWDSNVVARRILATGSPVYARAFAKVCDAQMRGMPAVLNLEEQKSVEAVRALTVGTGSGGGFAVPYTLDPTVVPTSNYSVNPYRQIARTETITGLQWNGVTAGGVTAAYAAEAAEATDGSPTFAQPTLNVIRAQAFVPVSFELAQDWPAVQTELAQLISDAKDDLEATQFTTGVGDATHPTGIITGATSTQAAAGTASFAIADLYTLEQSLAPRFRPRSVMVANRFTINKVRQFDTAGGSGVWALGPAEGQLGYGLPNRPGQGGNLQAEIIGYPVFESSAMAAALTTGSKIVVFGDFRYFLIVDRIGMDIEVIPHLFGSANRFPTGQRGIYAYWRNNSQVLSTAAFKVLVTG
jgi:HK97 family phage major capsid protein